MSDIDDNNCEDILVGGARGTVMRLLEECGLDDYVRVVSFKEGPGTSLPEHLEKRAARKAKYMRSSTGESSTWIGLSISLQKGASAPVIVGGLTASTHFCQAEPIMDFLRSILGVKLSTLLKRTARLVQPLLSTPTLPVH